MPDYVRHGIGDDAAVLRAFPGRDLLHSTDMLVEGVDFDFTVGATHYQVGYKALAANLSDIAAMGGRPVAFLAGIAAPGKTPVHAIDELYRGMRALADRHGLALIGGDLSASNNGLVLSITVIGIVPAGRAVRRTGARIGDRIFITGSPGEARAGLELMKKRRSSKIASVVRSALVRRHQYPTPRVEFGEWLGRRNRASAMIDVSDGTASDLRHLCEAGGVGALLEIDSIPVSAALRAFARMDGSRPAELALRGGEDFELLFTSPSKYTAEIARAARRLGLRVTPIGTIVPKARGLGLLDSEGRRRPMTLRGYEHFSHPR